MTHQNMRSTGSIRFPRRRSVHYPEGPEATGPCQQFQHYGQSLLRVLERWQHLKPVLCAAWQHNLVVREFEIIIRNDNQSGAHTQEATDRQNGVWILAITRHKEVVDLADRFIRLVDDAGTDNLGRPIAGRDLLHIDLCDFYCL